MNDKLPPLPTPEAWRTHVGPWDCSTAYAYTVNQMREYAAQAVAAEREACAKVCEQLEPRHRMDGEWLAGWSDGTDDCAAAIRARGQKESPPV